GIAPGFFAWAVPSSPGRARVGLGTAQREALRGCFARLMGQFPGDPAAINGGLIPIGPPSRTVADRVILVGDAAAQAKPTSGGGLYTGIVCAKIAGEIAARAVKGGMKTLEEYERRWRGLLGRELWFGLLAHRLFAGLSDDELSRIIAALDDPEILGIIAEYGDIDYPSLLIKEMARRPRLWRKLLGLIPAKEVLHQALSLVGL
ncbi:MAG: NAD(P)/FAD-dependent oxidoreductase, partial [Candidatus Bipolaricaulia bacterium]